VTVPAAPVPAFLSYGDFRQHVTGQPAERCPEAVAIASKCLTAAASHMADLYIEGGAMAVADAAFVPGGPSREEIASRYEALIGRAAA
jgi:hypothetical protein